MLHEARRLPFVDWVEKGQFVADREPIDFAVWRHLRPIYAAVPNTIDELIDWCLCLMASSQNGKSIILLLFSIWLGLKIELMRGGYYLPTERKATDFSDTRWIGLVRENPGIHQLMGDPEDPHERQVIDEGAMSIRKLWRSIWYFFSLYGKVSTESNPLDAVFYDEVHAMALALIEKSEHRVDASRYKIKAYASTGGFEGSDIDYVFQRSDQRWFHTDCACPDGVILAKTLDATDGPLCVGRGNGTTPGVPRDYFYVCPKCHTILKDPLAGRYIAHRTDVRKRVGFQFPQMLSPRQTAESILEKWLKRISTQDYFNRVGGLGFTDPSMVPINDQVLTAAQNTDLRWGPPRRHDVEAVFMGLDQRLHEHHYVIKGKVGDRQRLLHLEVVQGRRPELWGRVRAVLKDFHVRYLVLEALPNADDAYELANEFPGRVFIISAYSDLTGAILKWGDRDRETVSDRHTLEDLKTPYTVTVHRYNMMQLALSRWVKGGVETPDARTLMQNLRTPQGFRNVMVCAELFWEHMKHVATVTELVGGEKKEDELKYRGVVKKIGPDDPHFAFANMFADIAWARDYGTQQILGDVVDRPKPGATPAPAASSYNDQLKKKLPGEVAGALPSLPGANKPKRLTCNDCAWFEPEKQRCQQLDMLTTPDAPKCESFVPVPQEDKEWR